MNPFMKRKNSNNELDQILTDILVNEGSDWTEYKIRKLNENSKLKMTDRVVSNLFRSIREKTMSLDFTDIDSSKGNVTDLRCYNDLANAIKFLRNLTMSNNKSVSANKDFTSTVDAIDVCMSILKKYSSDFSAAYKIKNVTVMYLYQSICIALIQGTSFVIAGSIELVKTGTGYQQNVKENQNLLKNNYIKSIIKFNDVDRSGKLKKALVDLQQIKEELVIGTVISTVLIISLVFSLMRSIIFTYFQARVALSQYLNTLRQFILLNSSTVADKKVKEKQEKIAEKLKHLSDIIAVDQTVANDRANSDMKDDDRGTAGQTSDQSEDDDDMGIF